MRLVKILIVLFLFSCAKDKVQPVVSEGITSYQSDGNFLILVIGDSLETIYEYDLPAIQLANDSLQISVESVPGGTGLNDTLFWKIEANNDTLFWTYSNNFNFMEEDITSDSLLFLCSTLAFNVNQFQFIHSNSNFETEDLWNKVAALEIIKEYRESSPNSKIGISRQVFFTYDEELGFSVPIEKHLMFLVK